MHVCAPRRKEKRIKKDAEGQPVSLDRICGYRCVRVRMQWWWCRVNRQEDISGRGWPRGAAARRSGADVPHTLRAQFHFNPHAAQPDDERLSSPGFGLAARPASAFRADYIDLVSSIASRANFPSATFDLYSAHDNTRSLPCLNFDGRRRYVEYPRIVELSRSLFFDLFIFLSLFLYFFWHNRYNQSADMAEQIRCFAMRLGEMADLKESDEIIFIYVTF